MWWRKGWILNSLNYQIEKNLRETVFCNEAYRDNQWNLIERQVLHWSEYPKKYVLLLFVAFLLSTICVYMWLPDIRNNVIKWNQPWGDLIKWQYILLAAQLTIIGLIFPLVVGFVGLLLQSKTANRSLWLIYSRYSGFMFIGLSGLSLSGVIVIGQFIHPWLSYSQDIIFSIGISFWFLFNIFLAAWFLHATFKFVSNEKRNSLVSRYCTNDVLVTEIKARLSVLIPSNAISLKLLPENREDDTSPEVVTYYYPKDNYSRYEINFKSKRYLHNVYFGVLKAAVYFWRALLIFHAQTGERPHLQLPISGKARSSKEWTISLSEPEIHPIVKGLVRLAYSFRRSPGLGGVNIKPILNALVGEVDDALKDRNIRLFEIALNDVREWHVLLLDAAVFKNNDGEWDNWFLLPDGSFGSRSLLDELSREYFELARTAAQLLINSKRFYEKFCYFYLRIYGYKNRKLAGKVVDGLIMSHYQLWFVLLDWKNYGESGDDESVVATRLESVIRSFVGTWEQWPNRLPLEVEDWSKSHDAINQHLQHLMCSARLVITSLRYENYMATEWAIDMMNHWLGTVYTGPDPYLHGWRGDVLIHTLLGKDTADPIWQWILNTENLDSQASKKDAVRIAVSNTWFDVRLATAAYIINKPKQQLSQELISLTAALVTGKRIKSGGGVERIYHHVRSGADILNAYIRQRWYWKDGAQEYGDWLDGVIESFGQIEEPEYVTGRVYSGWGSKDIRHLKRAYLVLSACYSSREWVLSKELKGFLYSDAVELQHREILLDDLNDWLNPSEDDIGKVKLYLGDSYSDDYIDNLKRSIEDVIENIRSQDAAVVSNAPIDQQRLLSFARAASSAGFTIASQLIPQSLFSDVEYVDILDEEYKYTCKITGYDRSNIAEGVEVNRAVNEEEWMDDLISKSISSNILKRLINTADFTELGPDDNEQLLIKIIEDASSMQSSGYKPILLVGPWKLSNILDSVLWGYAEDINIPELEVRKDDGFPNDYICHLNGIEVYMMPFMQIDFSVLVAEECFRVIRFQYFEIGQYVQVHYEEKENNPSSGDLIFEYKMELEFSETPSYKYISTPDEE